MQYIAFDVHKRYTFAVVESSDGQVVQEMRIDHENGNVRKFLAQCEPGSPGAVETIGSWYWMVDEGRPPHRSGCHGPEHWPSCRSTLVGT